MNTKQFIEKAIEGGWEIPKGFRTGGTLMKVNDSAQIIMTESIFLDPKAWEAVGKIGGLPKWDNPNPEKHYVGALGRALHYRDHMHRMIDALIEGKSIDEYLETL